MLSALTVKLTDNVGEIQTKMNKYPLSNEAKAKTNLI